MTNYHSILWIGVVFWLCACQSPTRSTTEQPTDLQADTQAKEVMTPSQAKQYPENYERSDNSNTDFQDYEAVVAVLERWNQAINAQDMESLEELYADELTYYMKSISKERLMAKKEAAFKKSPNYYQQLAYINVSYPEGPRTVVKCRFEKIYRQDVKADATENDTVRAFLELDVSIKPFTIVKESDDISDFRVAQNLAASKTPFPKGKHSFSHTYWEDRTDEDRDYTKGKTELSINYTEDTLSVDLFYQSSNGPGFATGYFYKDITITADAIRFKAAEFSLDYYDYILDRLFDGDETLEELVPASEFSDHYYKIVDFHTIVQIAPRIEAAKVFKRETYQRPRRTKPKEKG